MTDYGSQVVTFIPYEALMPRLERIQDITVRLEKLARVTDEAVQNGNVGRILACGAETRELVKELVIISTGLL